MENTDNILNQTPAYQPEMEDFFAAEDDFVPADEIVAAQPAPEPIPEPEEAPEAAPKKKKCGCKWIKKTIVALLIVSLVAGSCFLTAVLVNNDWNDRMKHLEQDFNQQLEAVRSEIPSIGGDVQNDSTILPAPTEGMTPAQVYAENVKAVVGVTNFQVVNYYGQSVQAASGGSGFIISDNGYVITNYHVVEGAVSLSVTTYDGKEYPAELIGYDEITELALMKFEGENLPYVTLGSSDQLVVGDQVVAIGNPLGELTATLTVGYVSAKDRLINTDGVAINMLQTDAAINSGNSGGPLFNMKGEVVGITTAKFSGTSTSGASIEGIGFAVPMDDVIALLEPIAKYGYVPSAYIGVDIRDVDESAQAYGLPAGAYVNRVVEGTPAEKAGVQAQDIIIGLGEYQVTSYDELARALRKFNVGDITTITVYRSGTELELPITLSEKPWDGDTQQSQQSQQPQQTTPQQTQPQQGSEDYFEDWWNQFPFFDW